MKVTPEIERRVLELCRDENMSQGKIAKELGISRPTVSAIIKKFSQKSTETEATPTVEESPMQPSEVQEKPAVTNNTVEEAIEEAIPPEPEPEDLVLIPPVAEPRRKGRGRPPLAESGEVKRATTVAILPSVYDAAKKICYVQRRSISDIINGFLEKFVAENLNDLGKY